MKPCPFCASNEINLHYPDEHGHYVCWCGNCGAYGPNDVSEAKAREMWNLRRPMDDLLAACVSFSDAHYIEDTQVNVDPHDWGKFDAAIAAAQPVTEQAAQPSGITPKSHLR